MSRRTMPYHRHYHGDALNGCCELSLEERGAYWTLLNLMYDRASPIKYDRTILAGHFRCSVRKVDVLISSLIERQKIYLTIDGRLSNHRFEQELCYSLELSRKQAEKGSKPKRKPAEIEKKPNDISASVEPRFIRSETIPEPEPDLIEKPEFVAAREGVAIGDDSSRRLSDALNRRTVSRWPVPSRGLKPVR
jgi:uncharacterized protein YdaU (DUF1376 family)